MRKNLRGLLLSGAILALAGCNTLENYPASPPVVTQVLPQEMASLDPANSILFWSDERRSAAFRDMEDSFVGLNVAPANVVRQLPRGDALDAETAAAIRSFMKDTQAAGVMVLQDGRVRFEEYGLGLKPDERWTSFSVAKSFTSTLLGAAITDGFVAGLDQQVVDVIPELKGTAYDGVTIGQVATMTSGVGWVEDYTDPNSDVAKMLAVEAVPGELQVITYARTLKRVAPPGEKWVYNTLETNLLGLIVEEATQMPLANYAASKIVEPAGLAGDMFWMQDLSGGNIGGCCISLRLSDYARFGQFALEGGHGTVPDGWFTDAGKPHVSFAPRAPGFGYGYQWWAYPNGAYGAQGIFGQAITIVPEKRLVVAVVSNWPTATSSDYRNSFREVVSQIN